MLYTVEFQDVYFSLFNSHPSDKLDYTKLNESCLSSFGSRLPPFLVLEGYDGNTFSLPSTDCVLDDYPLVKVSRMVSALDSVSIFCIIYKTKNQSSLKWSRN